MDKMFYAKSVAIIGVADEKGNLGARIFRNMKHHGYQGTIYPVHRRGGEIDGQEIFKSIFDVPVPIDFAIIMITAKAVPGAMEECGKLGIPWVEVLAGGFSETSEEFKYLDQQLVEIAERYGMKLIGPNCVGVINTENSLIAEFHPMTTQTLLNGPIGVIAQSGSVAVETQVLFSLHKIGINKCVSMGNKLLTNEVDLLRYFVEEDETIKQVSMYLEGISDGRGLFSVASRSRKPIVMYKANIVPGGNPAAKSHTAALASDDRIVDAACRQANIIRASDSYQLISYTKAMALPPMRGNHVAVVGISGGAGVTAADFCYKYGLDLPALPEKIIQLIESRLEVRAIARRNPLDLGDAFDYDLALACLEGLLASDEFDGIVFHLVGDPNHRAVGASLIEATNQAGALGKKYNKPVAICYAPILMSIDDLRLQVDYPVFDRSEEAVEALAVSRTYWLRAGRNEIDPPSFDVDRAKVEAILFSAKSVHKNDLGEDSLKLLQSYGIPVEGLIPAGTPDEAIAIARKIGYPVVLKVNSPQISHKSDVGGVAVNIKNDDEVISAFHRIIESAHASRPEAEILGVTVQKMVTKGVEVIIGANVDAQFGPVIMVGLGGVMVELLHDVSFRLAPITELDAREMIEELKSNKMLKGFRGQPPADIDSVVNVLVRLSQLLIDFPEIAEVDLNPVKIFPQGEGCCAVDARIFMRT